MLSVEVPSTHYKFRLSSSAVTTPRNHSVSDACGTQNSTPTSFNAHKIASKLFFRCSQIKQTQFFVMINENEKNKMKWRYRTNGESVTTEIDKSHRMRRQINKTHGCEIGWEETEIDWQTQVRNAEYEPSTELFQSRLNWMCVFFMLVLLAICLYRRMLHCSRSQQHTTHAHTGDNAQRFHVKNAP